MMRKDRQPAKIEDVPTRESGARKPVEAQRRPDVLDTGDRGDAPRTPYGLTEPNDDRGDATRHHDGRNPKRVEGR